MKIEVGIDDKNLQTGLTALIKEMSDLSNIMDEIGAALVSSTQERFETNIGPDGKRWARSARASAQGGPTLVDRGYLRDSITHVPSKNAVEVGSNIIYAAIHQLGGKILPKTKKALKFRLPNGGWATVRSVTIPARPYLGLSADDATEITGIIDDAVREALGAN